MRDIFGWEYLSQWDAFAKANEGFDKTLPTLVQRAASLARSDHPAVLSRFASGVFVVFHITFNDTVAWVCRVHKNDPKVSPACVKSKVDSTVATMRYIKSRLPSFPIPQIYAYESDAETSVLNAAYIFMEPMDGTEFDHGSVEDEVTVYQQLASVSWQLSGLRFPKIGRIQQSRTTSEFYVGPFVDAQGNQYGPFETATEYYASRVRKIETKHTQWRLKNVDKTEQSLEICALYETTASILTEYSTGSFPLFHPDFSTHNALFRRDPHGSLQITAIIDWDYAHTSPWLQFCTFPVFAGIRWPTLERGKYAQFVLERIYRRQQAYLRQLKEEEENSGSPPTTERPAKLYTVVDSSAVRVSEFILKYSDLRFQFDGDMLRKYLRGWREDIDW